MCPLLSAPTLSFFFSHLLFYFLQYFFSTRSTREWTTKIFTAIRCNLLSIEKQVDAPIIGLENVCSKTQSSRANFGILIFFQTDSSVTNGWKIFCRCLWKKKFAQFRVYMQKLWQFYGGIIKSGFQEELRLGFDG